MLPKSSRLNLKLQFKWVASGKRIETSGFKLFVKSGDNTKPLVGVALSSKVLKSSTERNKAKRLAFRAAAHIYESLPKNVNLVIMPKGRLVEMTDEEIAGELRNVLLTN